MTVRVRPASEQDADQLAALSRIVLEWHAVHYPNDFRGDTPAAELEAFFRQQISAEGTGVAIAEIAGAPVGYVFFSHKLRHGSPFTPRRPPQLFVEHIVVVPGARRQGVGSALMAFVDGLGEMGAEIALETMEQNSAAQAFFARQGFTVQRLTLRKLATPA